MAHEYDPSLNTPNAWGFLEKLPTGREEYVKLPKTPMLLAGMGPPPFDVTLPHTQEVRHIIELEEYEPGKWRPINV